MTLVYFDPSAFVKLLVEEDGSDLAADLWDACDAAISSRLAFPDKGLPRHPVGYRPDGPEADVGHKSLDRQPTLLLSLWSCTQVSPR